MYRHPVFPALLLKDAPSYSVELRRPCHLSGDGIHSYFVPSIYMSVWRWLCAVSISLDL